MFTGNRESHNDVLSAPTSPVDPSQTPLKLSSNIGRNPLRGSKCKTLLIFFFFQLFFNYNSLPRQETLFLCMKSYTNTKMKAFIF